MKETLQRIKERVEFNKGVARAMHDQRGSSTINAVVGITVAAIVIAFVGVVGVDQLADTGLSANASTGATSIFGILDLIVVLAFLLLLIGMALNAS